jgi:hypothetical protein
MNKTIHSKMIGNLIHSDCEQHHCKDTLGARREVEPSKSLRIRGQELDPPEFLHCGFWPSPQRSDHKEENQDSYCTGRTKARSWSPKDLSNVVGSWVIDNDGASFEDLTSWVVNPNQKG